MIYLKKFNESNLYEVITGLDYEGRVHCPKCTNNDDLDYNCKCERDFDGDYMISYIDLLEPTPFTKNEINRLVDLSNKYLVYNNDKLNLNIKNNVAIFNKLNIGKYSVMYWILKANDEYFYLAIKMSGFGFSLKFKDISLKDKFSVIKCDGWDGLEYVLSNLKLNKY